MMSVSKARTAQAATSYYLHLREGRGALDDYYAKEGDPGRWAGKAAAAFELAGQVDGRQFDRLANGYSPDGSAALVQNAGDAERRAGWDLTFSAPKGVGVVWGLADDDLRAKIEEVQRAAVERAFDFLEEKAAFARVGKHGEGAANELEAVKLIAATFQHGTSRDGDMQLHTHCFVFNQGLRESGVWAALESKGFMAWQKAAGAAYRAELAVGLQRLGFQVERDGQSFRLANVPQDIEQHFSQARSRILEELASRGLQGAKAAEIANLNTRQAKGELDPAALRAEWNARTRVLGYDPQELTKTREEVKILDAPSAEASLDAALSNSAVAREQDLYTAAFQGAQGAQGMLEAQRQAEYLRDHLSVRLERESDGQLRYSSRDIVDKELAILRWAKEGRDSVAHRVAPDIIENAISRYETRKSAEVGKGFALRAEQAEAVRHLASESGQVAVLVGDAGSGKSTALEAVKDAFEAAGFEVRGAAVAGKAAAGLQESAGIESQTIAKLVNDLERNPLTATTVLVIDEAGMADANSLHTVLAAAQAGGAKVILVGDAKQLQPVGPGASFRHIENAAGHARLETIVRQRDEWRREAVKAMSRGDAAKAMIEYVDRGLVSISGTYATAIKSAAEKYIAAADEVGKDKTVGIAATNRAVNDLNERIRARLQERGDLAKAKPVEFASGRLSVATGERLLVTKNATGMDLKNGDFITVKEIKGGDVLAKVDRTGETVALTQQQHVRYGYAATTHKLQGATVERAVVLAHGSTTREMAYVQDSRAKGNTEWIVTKNAVDKAMDKVKPTDKMLALAHSVAKHKGVELQPEVGESFRECRRYLDREAYHIGLPSAGGIDSPSLADFRDVVEQMGKSRPGETTLDYRELGQPDFKRAIDAMEREAGLQTAHERTGLADRELAGLDHADKAPDVGRSFDFEF